MRLLRWFKRQRHHAADLDIIHDAVGRAEKALPFCSEVKLLHSAVDLLESVLGEPATPGVVDQMLQVIRKRRAGR
jgi:hypothetical protein